MTDSPDGSGGPEYGDRWEHELLTAWRNERIDAIGKSRLGRIAAAVFRQIRRQAIAVPEDVCLSAQAGDSTAWIRIADVVSGGGDFFAEDREASCLLIASAQGAKWASMILMVRLAQASVEDVEPEIRSANFLTLSGRFYLHGVAPHSVAMSLSVRVEFIKGVTVEQSSHGKKPDALQPEAPKESEVAEPQGEAMRVILQKPLKSTDKNLNAMLEGLASLENPLRLVPSPDPMELADQLRAEFPWAASVTEEIEIQLLLDRRLGSSTFCLPPLMLLGASGSGKTRYVSRLSALIGVPSMTLVVAGSTDNRSLAGTARGWGSSTPSFPVQAMQRSQVANPMMIIEEIDKAGGSERNGHLADTLLTMLDPTLAGHWFDECLQAEVDLSKISWIMTGNRRDLIPAMLRARCRVLEFPPPRREDFDVLLSGVLADLAASYSVEIADLPVPDEGVYRRLRAGFMSHRLTARQLAQLVRRALALQVASDSIGPLH